MDVREIIRNLIAEALKDLDISVEQILLDHPTEISHGDYSTSVAMSLAKKMKANPLDLAEQIVTKINKHEYIESINVAGVGFINFFLSQKFYEDSLARINFDFGKTNIHDGKTILV